MRLGMVIGLALLLVGWSAAQETVRFSLNLTPGGGASRILTGKLKGEWIAPSPVPVEIDLRISTYIVINNILQNGDAVVLVQPQGVQIKGKAGETPLEWTITPAGDVIAQWGDTRFDSSKLPEEQRSKWRKAWQASTEIVLTPQGRIKSVKMPEVPKDLPGWTEVPGVSRVAHQIVMGLLQTLWLPLLPTEPVKVGSKWQVEVPLPMVETEQPPSLPYTCTLAKLSWDEAVIQAEAEHKADLSLSLRRFHPNDPKVTVNKTHFALKGEISFLTTIGVPQKAKWSLKGEISGTVTPEGMAPEAFTFRYEAEVNDQLEF